MEDFLSPAQKDAMRRLRNGDILCSKVGSGKSRTAIAYYYQQVCGGKCDEGELVPMTDPKPLYIITTAKKRDTLEWDKDLNIFLLSSLLPEESPVPVKVDSWNNIAKYVDVKDAFFIFDEQRVVGSGAWVKSFLKITKKNQWILLSATPGDNWKDYIPVFLAHGFYRSRTEFKEEHMVISYYGSYPKLKKYVGVGKLRRLRASILVDMDYISKNERVTVTLDCSYDKELYRKVSVERWHIYENRPIANVSEYCQLLRKVVNSDVTRQNVVVNLSDRIPKLIIFYNYDYELMILKMLPYREGTVVVQWNGHAHEEIPDTDRWVYLVQYTAGAEGWNCIETDSMLFYSQTYSYKTMEQACGRIDRFHNIYHTLYYYHLRSDAPIDRAIFADLKQKKKFNESAFAKGLSFEG